MNARDVMTTHVITVGPDACVQDVAALLLKNRISALPVVDADGRLVGIVSEGDLMRRIEAGTEVRRASWLEFFTSTHVLADEFVRSHSQKVGDVMTRHVITAAPDTPLGELAALLERNRIKRVPIVKNGAVVGIVSRANLLQALASLKKRKAPKVKADDAAIRDSVVSELRKQTWARPSLVNVLVEDGTVDLWGMVETEAERKAVRVLAELVPGVRAVNDNISVRHVQSGY